MTLQCWYGWPGQTSQWSDFHCASGCINDANCLKYLLINKLGFREENVRMLTDDQQARLRLLWLCVCSVQFIASFTVRLSWSLYRVIESPDVLTTVADIWWFSLPFGQYELMG